MCEIRTTISWSKIKHLDQRVESCQVGETFMVSIDFSRFEELEPIDSKFQFHHVTSQTFQIEFFANAKNYFYFLRSAILTQLCDLKSSENLNLSHNMFSGLISSWFEGMNDLSRIDISYNKEGQIPNSAAFRVAPIEVLQGNEGLCGDVESFAKLSMLKNGL